MHTQARAAPFTSRADHQEPTRSARKMLHSFECHVKAGTWHLAQLTSRLLVTAHTQTSVVYLNQSVKVSEGVEAVGNDTDAG